MTLPTAGPSEVLLRGGPMDGWLVTADAPVLGPDWPGVEGQPGHYAEPKRRGLVWEAKWVPEPGVSDDQSDVSDRRI